MIVLKESSWKRYESDYGTISYTLFINGTSFISIVEISDDQNDNILSAFSGRKKLDKYYIHPISDIFTIKGNEGMNKWGWFNNLDDCKKKSEEILRELILSFIDMRDYKIGKILNGDN